MDGGVSYSHNSTQYPSPVGLSGQIVALTSVLCFPTACINYIRIEWDLINVVRDIYGRLVLGQYFLPGGQGPGLQQPRDPSNSTLFEQTKVVDKPLQGGGILPHPTDYPRRILSEIGMSRDEIITLEGKLSDKRSAKEQKEAFRDVLRVAADKTLGQNGLLERAGEEESLLHKTTRKPEVTALPEVLTTYSMLKKLEEKEKDTLDASAGPWHGNLFP